MSPPPRLSGKVALVTGAASGFGRGIATKFLSEGAHVLIADLDTTAGQKTADDLNSLVSSSSSSSSTSPSSPPLSLPTAIFHRADVTSHSDWTALLQTALDRWGRLDIVVNNAGATYANKPTETVTERDFDLCFNVNVKAIWLSTVVLLPYLLDAENAKRLAGQGGHGQGQEAQGGACFINVASTAGTRPRPGLAWYNASKAAVINATKSLAIEYGPKQIRFNSVAPVFGSGTGLSHLFLGKPDTPENRAGFVATVPLGRGSTPADVANACCYLASDEAAFITGVNLEVDGGRSI